MSTGALFVARFTGPENLVSATAALKQCSEVRSWSAVSGHAHLIATLATPASRIPRSLTSLSGIAAFTAYDIEDGGRTVDIDPSLCYAYAFLEADPARSPEIVRALAEHRQTAWYAEVPDRREIIALIRGENFESVDRHIDRDIRTLDGVIRLKADRVIDLRQL